MLKCSCMMFLQYRFCDNLNIIAIFVCLLLKESHFRTIGTFVAMSIIQGGFGLPIFSQHLYSYLVTGKYVNLEINNDDVPDPAAQALLKQVIYTLYVTTWF